MGLWLRLPIVRSRMDLRWATDPDGSYLRRAAEAMGGTSMSRAEKRSRSLARRDWAEAWRWARGERRGYGSVLRFAAVDALNTRHAPDETALARQRLLAGRAWGVAL